MTGGRTYDFFLSYPWENRKEMRALRNALGADDVWADELITDNQPWDAAITYAMRRSRLFVILCNRESFDDRVQRTEADEAIALATWDSEHRQAVMVTLEKDLAPPPDMNLGQPLDLSGGDYEGIARELKSQLKDISPLPSPWNTAVERRPEPEKRGAVLTCNVRGYTTMNTRGRNAVTARLLTEVQAYVSKTPQVQWIDFREGEFTVFHEVAQGGDPGEVVQDLVGFGYHLMATSWGGPELGKRPVGIGVLVHWTDRVTWRNIRGSENDSSFLTGLPLQTARMILASSNHQQLLVTPEASQWLAHLDEMELPSALAKHALKANRIGPIDGQEACHFRELTFMVSHRATLKAHSLRFERNAVSGLGDHSDPRPRVSLDLRYRRRDLRKNPFVMGLAECDEATVLGFTHEGTHGFLAEALEIRLRRGKEHWDRLRIVFPGVKYLDQINDQYAGAGISKRRDRWEEGRSRLNRFLASHMEEGQRDWLCVDYQNTLPFLGQHFITRPDRGSFRIGPILPGSNVRDSFYFEVAEGVDPYTQLEKTFGFILSNSRAQLEWVLTGDADEDGNGAEVTGLCEHKRLGELTPGESLFVTLVVLHTKEDPPRAILQHRTRLNASTNLGTYSNISGLLTGEDVLAALRQTRDPESQAKIPSAAYLDLPCFHLTGEANPIEVDAPSDQFVREVCAALDQREAKLELEVITAAYLEAATRELQEELGIKFGLERLRSHHTKLVPKYRDNKAALFFQIHSLAISDQEFRRIEDKRRHCELSKLDEKGVRSLMEACQLNALLDEQFEEVFVPVYRELGIFTQ